VNVLTPTLTRTDPTSRPRVTILTPVFNEEASLPLYESAVVETLFSRSEYDFTVVFVDDGSTDRSWAAIVDLCRRDRRFRGIRLSRNYGSHIALSAGFADAEGDAVTTLACDLQDPPEVILRFLEKWRAGADIVWGRREKRAESAWRVWTSGLFEALIRRFAMPRGSRFTVGSFLLVDRRVAECFCQFQEHNRVTFALVAWTGFTEAVVDYNRVRRVAGNSGWTYSKMVKTLYDAFIGFSFLPIRVMTFSGLALAILTVPLAIYLVVAWMTGRVFPGWTSIMLALAFFFGIQFLLMGIVGEYLYRIYAEVVRRPLYFVSATAGCRGTPSVAGE
jgi:dolichol-phosphate mannosyltransferase